MEIKFNDLWDNHPNNGGDSTPCKDNEGKPAFENQCAIRMGIALEKAGFSLASFQGKRCWYNHHPKHILRAEELANWLKIQISPIAFKKFSGANAYEDAISYMRRRRGIVFYKDFWGTNGQGDHIDLWNRFYATKEFESFMASIFTSAFSYKNAKEVWFWEIWK